MAPTGSTEHPGADDVVVVSWPKDRERYQAVLRELPLMRFLRSAMWWSLVVSAALALLLWAARAAVLLNATLLPSALRFRRSRAIRDVPPVALGGSQRLRNGIAHFWSPWGPKVGTLERFIGGIEPPGIRRYAWGFRP